MRGHGLTRRRASLCLGWTTASGRTNVSFLVRLPRFLVGKLSRRTLFAFILPAASASYFGSLAIAIRLLPEPVDWRSTTISKLALYPQNNPKYSWIASAGIALAAALIIPFAGHIGGRLRSSAPLGSRIGAGIFRIGAASAVLVGVIGYHGNSRFPRLHTLLAREAAFALFASMIVFLICALWGRFVSAAGGGRCGLFLVTTWCVLALSGPSAAALSALETAHRLHRLGGLYEWAASVVFFLFLLSSALLPPEQALQASPQGPSTAKS